MKKYFLVYVVVFACCLETPFAQIKINTPSAQQQPLLQIPVAHVTNVKSRFVPVHIDTVKPFVVSLRPIVFGNQESAACNYFKTLQPTLVLTAQRANDVLANLEWHTKYAFYATRFTIERSLGDSLHFSGINTTAALRGGRFKKRYSSPDYNAYGGLSFYRIKQSNGDTGFIYSNIVPIKGVETLPFTVYPNPASNRIWVDVAIKKSGDFTIMVYDPSGKIVQKQNASGTKNSIAVQSLDISKLAAGFYQVKVFMPDKSFSTGKFIKK